MGHDWRVGRGEGFRGYGGMRGGPWGMDRYPARCWNGWGGVPPGRFWFGVGAGAAIAALCAEAFYPRPYYVPQAYVPPPTVLPPQVAAAPAPDASAQVAQLTQANQALMTQNEQLQKQIAAMNEQLAQIQAQLKSGTKS